MCINKFLLVTFVGVALIICPKTHAAWPERIHFCENVAKTYCSTPSVVTCFVQQRQLIAVASITISQAADRISLLNAHINDVAENLALLKKLHDSIVQASLNIGQWQLLLDTARDTIKGDQQSLSSWKDAINTLIARLKDSHRPIVPNAIEPSVLSAAYWRTIYSKYMPLSVSKKGIEQMINAHKANEQKVNEQIELLTSIRDGMMAAIKSSSVDLVMYSGNSADSILGLGQLSSDLIVHLLKKSDEYKVELAAANDAYAARLAEYATLVKSRDDLDTERYKHAFNYCIAYFPLDDMPLGMIREEIQMCR